MPSNLSWTGKNVFIVDDMEKVRTKVAELYQSVGLTIIGSAENGQQALEMIPKLKPDLISLDIVMPIMDGIECYRAIQQLNHDLWAGKISEAIWPQQMRCMILSCLGNEARIVAHYAQEIPEMSFVAKYPSGEQLIKHLNFVFNQSLEPKPRLESKESA